MVRPRLEWLEARFVPTALPSFAGPADFAQSRANPFEQRPAEFTWPTGNSPFAFGSPAAADAVFAMGRPIEPLMSQIGRFPEPSLEFAPSGHGAEPPRDDLLLPATAPVSAPSADQVDELFMEPEPEAAPQE